MHQAIPPDMKSHLLLPIALTVACNGYGVEYLEHDTEIAGDVGTAPEATSTHPSDDFMAALDHVDLAELSDGVHLVGLDADNIEIGRIALEHGGEDEAKLRLVSRYRDGGGIVTLHEEAVATGDLPPDVLVSRANAIVDVYASQEQRSALECAVPIASAVALCAPLALGQPYGSFTCPAGVVIAWCGCAEEVGLDDGGLCEDF